MNKPVGRLGAAVEAAASGKSEDQPPVKTFSDNDIAAISAKILQAITDDYQDRTGFRHVYDECDDDVKNEIAATQARKIAQIFHDHPSQ